MKYDFIKEEIQLLNDFYDYLKKSPNDCVMDTIKEFCFDKNVEYEYLGDLIAENKDLKDYIEKNLKKFHYFKTLEITNTANASK